jgi:FkbM family methyltransferase
MEAATMWFDRLMAQQFRGMGRLRSQLRGGYPTTLVRARTVDGLLFALDPDSYCDRFVIEDGYWEREVLDAVLENLSDDGVFWDIGANIGLHSITTMFHRPKAKVFAFEPVPFTAARAMMNAKMNNLDISVCSIALGDKSRAATLSVKLTQNSGLSSFVPWSHTVYEGTVLCAMDRGDNLVPTIPAPTVIKLDVEGFEAQTLAGLQGVLSTAGALIFESHDECRSLRHLIPGDMRIERLRAANTKESGYLSPNFMAVRS